MQNFRKTLISKTPITPDEVVTKRYAKKIIEENNQGSGSGNIVWVNVIATGEELANDIIVTADKSVKDICNFIKNGTIVKYKLSFELGNIFPFKELSIIGTFDQYQTVDTDDENISIVNDLLYSLESFGFLMGAVDNINGEEMWMFRSVN